MKKFLALSIFVLFAFSMYAQLTISGEFRPRTEYAHGLKTLAEKDMDATIWTQQRTRLIFDYKNPNIESRISFQDVRTWGSQPQLIQSDELSSIHEAWVKIRLSDNLALKAGRQEVIYDDHRIFGNVGWAHQARSHDMAIIKFSNEKWFNADIGIAYNQNQLPADSFMVGGNYKALQYLWVNRKLGDHAQMSLLFLNNGNQFSKLNNNVWERSIIYSQTTGTRITYKKLFDLLNLAGAYYMQTGKDANDVDLNAMYLNFEAALFLIDEKMMLTGGFELLSGTDQTATKQENNSFTPFYGTNHKFNGHMDYFYVGNHVNNVGLQDAYFKLTYKLKKFSPGVNFHMFSADGDIIDPSNPSGTLDALLGYEFDFYFGYKLNDLVSFKLGYSQMLATESMEALKGGDKDELNNWGWIMLNVTPKFFISK